MTSKIIIANWKMNGSRAFASELVQNLEAVTTKNTVVLCPPAPYLGLMAAKIGGQIALGAQDVNVPVAKSGAQTGDISPAMLVDLGCKYVILGHSERRAQHNETNDTVKNKATAALDAGLTPIICVGESAELRARGNANKTVLDMVLASIPDQASAENIILAYEPVWAIGAGTPATLDDIAQMHGFLYMTLTETLAHLNGLRMVYGGSVKADNARNILNVPHVDGVLVGGASLKADEFAGIMMAGV